MINQTHPHANLGDGHAGLMQIYNPTLFACEATVVATMHRPPCVLEPEAPIHAMFGQLCVKALSGLGDWWSTGLNCTCNINCRINAITCVQIAHDIFTWGIAIRIADLLKYPLEKAFHSDAYADNTGVGNKYVIRVRTNQLSQTSNGRK